MDLIEKDEASNTPVARAQARCWRSVWVNVKQRFERITGESLHSGMKVMLRVKAQFHEAYGFSWIVQDIDPNYTLGDMARRRQEIIRILKAEGVFDLNKQLEIPMFAQRIAVISSASAAGYGDFCNQLIDNEYGFQFVTNLFPAIMQGEQVEESVIAALDRINEHVEDYDVVVIIRGGGGTSDLSGFDTLDLAENVANFPLPVITGIGHDRDESVLDMISCVRVKTPTAAADFLISNLADTLSRINDASARIVELVRSCMERERQRITRYQSFIPVAISLVKTRQEARLNQLATRMTSNISTRISTQKLLIENLASRIPSVCRSMIDKERFRIEMLAQRTEALDPIHILRRGYAIALHDGKAIKSPSDVSTGDSINILIAEGVIETVKS